MVADASIRRMAFKPRAVIPACQFAAGRFPLTGQIAAATVHHITFTTTGSIRA